MTTAHRPTWNPARGGDSQSGNRWVAPRTAFSAKELPAHLTVKHRQQGQGSADDVARRDLRRELEAREGEHTRKRRRGGHAAAASEQGMLDFSVLDAEAAPQGGGAWGALLDPADADHAPTHEPAAAAVRSARAPASSAAHAAGAGRVEGDAADARAASESDASSSEEEDEEDEEEELMRELERIKKERADEAARRAAEAEEQAAAETEESILHSNPLVQPAAGAGAGAAAAAASSFNVKRRWDDDVVFRNQARAPTKAEPSFINDTLRTDFHKRFLNKYIK